MTYAKSSNQFKLFLLTGICLVSLTAGLPAMAQESTGYAPPPMFDDMTPPMVRPEAKDGYLVEPKVSPNTVLPESMNRPARAPTVLPRVSVDPDATKAATPPTPPVNVPPATTTTTVPNVPVSAPVAPATPAAQAPAAPVISAPTVTPPAVNAPAKPKMMKPIVEEVYIKRDKPALTKKDDAETKTVAPRPAKKPAPPTAPVEVKAPEKKVEEPKTKKADVAPVVLPAVPATPSSDVVAPATPSAKVPAAPMRDPKQSAIQGPKSMPALPTTSVEAKPTFQPDQPASDEPTILERQQKPAEEKTETSLIVPRPKDGVAPASFEAGEKGALKKVIPFQRGQITLPPADTDPIAAGVVKELADETKKDWRVQIRSSATAYGTGLASDKRIALNRALSLRSSLIAQGVPASKIDVLAEGAEGKSGAADEVDLYLYAPSPN